MKKIWIWGTGNCAIDLFKKNKNIIENSQINIEGFVDSNYDKQNMTFLGKRIVSPEILRNVEFDKLLIFSNKYYREIFFTAVNRLNIKAEKIDNINWILRNYLDENRKTSSLESIGKVYDCFCYFNEDALLLLRLKILYKYVDYFVIVEMNMTHRGEPKSYNLLKLKRELETYWEKIIYIQPSDIPSYKGNGDWSLENFQRNCIMKGLLKCKENDLIVISDLDEIVNPKVLNCCRRKNVLLDRLNFYPLVCEQELYYYNFKHRYKEKWYGSILIKYNNLKYVTPQILRDNRNYILAIPDGGWHLSYFGGVEKIYQKTRSIVEGVNVTKELIEKRIRDGIDVYGRDYEFEYIDTNNNDINYLEELLNEINTSLSSK